MLDSISRITLRFRDKTLEQRYTQHSDRNRALFIKYIYTFLMGMLAVIFLLQLLAGLSKQEHHRTDLRAHRYTGPAKALCMLLPVNDRLPWLRPRNCILCNALDLARRDIDDNFTHSNCRHWSIAYIGGPD